MRNRYYAHVSLIYLYVKILNVTINTEELSHILTTYYEINIIEIMIRVYTQYVILSGDLSSCLGGLSLSVLLRLTACQYVEAFDVLL